MSDSYDGTNQSKVIGRHRRNRGRKYSVRRAEHQPLDVEGLMADLRRRPHNDPRLTEEFWTGAGNVPVAG